MCVWACVHAFRKTMADSEALELLKRSQSINRSSAHTQKTTDKHMRELEGDFSYN